MHAVFDVSHLKSKIAVLENMLKGLSVQQPQSCQTSLVSYSHSLSGLRPHIKFLSLFFLLAFYWTRTCQHGLPKTKK